MIGTLLLGAFKFAVGCTKLGFKALKYSYRIGKFASKHLIKCLKKSNKLGKRVAKVIKQSRILTKESLMVQSSKTRTEIPEIKKSHIFTKEK